MPLKHSVLTRESLLHRKERLVLIPISDKRQLGMRLARVESPHKRVDPVQDVTLAREPQGPLKLQIRRGSR